MGGKDGEENGKGVRSTKKGAVRQVPDREPKQNNQTQKITANKKAGPWRGNPFWDLKAPKIENPVSRQSEFVPKIQKKSLDNLTIPQFILHRCVLSASYTGSTCRRSRVFVLYVSRGTWKFGTPRMWKGPRAFGPIASWFGTFTRPFFLALVS